MPSWQASSWLITGSASGSRGHDAGGSRDADATAGIQCRQHAAKRRNKSNPWFNRCTLFRSAVDVRRWATGPMMAREIADALIADEAVPASRKQFVDLLAAIHVALRKRAGGTVV